MSRAVGRRSPRHPCCALSRILPLCAGGARAAPAVAPAATLGRSIAGAILPSPASPRCRPSGGAAGAFGASPIHSRLACSLSLRALAGCRHAESWTSRAMLLRMDAGAGRDLPPFADVGADALAHRRGRAGLAFHALRHERRFAVGRTEYFIHLAIEPRDDRRRGGGWHDE